MSVYVSFIHFSELKQPSSLFVKHTSNEALQQVKDNECFCPTSCLKQLPEDLIRHEREEFWGKCTQQRKEYVYTSLKCSMKDDGSLLHSLNYNGHLVNVCGLSWKHLLSIPKHMYYICLKAVKNNAPVTKSMPRFRSSKKGTLNAMAWFARYSKMNGDRLPNKSIIRLPFGTHLTSVHKKYMGTIEPGQDYISYSAFVRIVNINFPNVCFMSKVCINMYI